MNSISTKTIDTDKIKKFIRQIRSSQDSFNSINSFMKIINNRYAAKILLGIYELGFSANFELQKYTNIKDTKYFFSVAQDLTFKGVLFPIRIDSDEYKLIKGFWKSEYPNSSRDPVYYKLNPEWSSLIHDFHPILLELSGGSNTVDLKGMQQRNKKYTYHLEKNRAEYEKINKLKAQSLGTCIRCGKLIHKDAVRGKDYHKYPAGMVCEICNKNIDMWPQWMYPNK